MTNAKYRRWSPLAWLLVGAFLVVGAVACSSAPPIEDMDHADQAEYLYQKGEQALEGGRYVRAVENFNSVRNEFPHSRWAADATLGIGDAYFEQNQFASAVAQYRGFIDLYPRHERVEYAHFQVAVSFYEQMPSGFFLMPSPHERDLSTTRDAARELHIFLNRFADSEYADEAEQMWREAMGRLARHELTVAEFYFDRDNPRATVQRLRHLLEHYQGLGLDAEALYLMGKAYLELGEPERAAAAWTDLVEIHSAHPRASDASQKLERL